EDVHVRVLAGALRREGVMADRSPHAVDLVGDDGRPHTVGADQDAEVVLPAGNRLREGYRDIRVVARLERVRAIVRDLVAEFGEFGPQDFLEFEAGVVGTNGNAHQHYSPASVAPCYR